MIRIDRDLAALRADISVLAPTWHTRAARRTATNRLAGHHVGKDGMWSEIKELFIAFQNSKCAYCERKLGDAAIEWDIEHFRPKSEVEIWPRQNPRQYLPGYHLLAFNLQNYLLACKVCNSTNKASYFPVLGTPQADTEDPALLRTEQPLLVNPLDPEDVDPSSLITFLGPTPQPVAEDGPDRYRALVVIDIFDLNRDDLVLERARRLLDVWIAYRGQSMAAPDGSRAARRLADYASAAGQHASCVRTFLRLCHSNEAQASSLVDAMERAVEANSAAELAG